MSTPPEFSWVPPVWDTTMPDLTVDPFNEDPGDPAPPPLSNRTPLKARLNLETRILALQSHFGGEPTHIEAKREVEDPQESDTGNPASKVPHPRSNFSHVDPGVFSGGQVNSIRGAIQALQALKGIASKDDEVGEAFETALGPSGKLGKVPELLGPSPRGMERLKLVFENILCDMTVLLGEINRALEADNPTNKAAYITARNRYVELLADLDDPVSLNITPGEKGYGRTIKWCYLRPLIRGGRIYGANVSVKWNPHISSSGVAIPHQ